MGPDGGSLNRKAVTPDGPTDPDSTSTRNYASDENDMSINGEHINDTDRFTVPPRPRLTHHSEEFRFKPKSSW